MPCAPFFHEQKPDRKFSIIATSTRQATLDDRFSNSRGLAEREMAEQVRLDGPGSERGSTIKRRTARSVRAARQIYLLNLIAPRHAFSL